MSKSLLNVFLILLTVAVYYLLISPLYTGAGAVWQPEAGIQKLQQQRTQYQNALSQAEALKQQALSVQRQYNALSDQDKADMMIMVPDSIDKVRMLSEFQGMMIQSGFIITDLRYVDGGSSDSTRGAGSLTFGAKMTYERFKDLMKVLEYSKRLYVVKSVNFQAPKDGGSIITYQIKVETYYMK